MSCSFQVAGVKAAVRFNSVTTHTALRQTCKGGFTEMAQFKDMGQSCHTLKM